MTYETTAMDNVEKIQLGLLPWDVQDRFKDISKISLQSFFKGKWRGCFAGGGLDPAQIYRLARSAEYEILRDLSSFIRINELAAVEDELAKLIRKHKFPKKQEDPS